MQTAQKVITTYRRKRILVCLLVALLTLTTTLVIRFISQRSLNQQRVQLSTNKMVAAMAAPGGPARHAAATCEPALSGRPPHVT